MKKLIFFLVFICIFMAPMFADPDSTEVWRIQYFHGDLYPHPDSAGKLVIGADTLHWQAGHFDSVFAEYMKTDSTIIEKYFELIAGAYAKFLGKTSFHDSVKVGAVFLVYGVTDSTFLTPLAIITSYAEFDSLKSSWAEYDSINVTYAEIDSIQGATINDQFAYQCAGDIFNIATNSIALLGWITPTTTEQDLSPHNHDFDYHNFGITDRTYKGLVWKLHFYEEANEWLHTIDHDDFTFDDAGGANGFTIGGWAEVVATSDSQTIWSKWDETTASELREWRMFIDDAETLVVMIYDESEDAGPYRMSDASISIGWHLMLAVYDGAGGVSAANGITFYVDGKVEASTPTNNVGYVGMENTDAPVFVGAIEGTGGTNKDFWQGDMGHQFITTDQLTADQCWELYLRTRGYYSE